MLPTTRSRKTIPTQRNSWARRGCGPCPVGCGCGACGSPSQRAELSRSGHADRSAAILATRGRGANGDPCTQSLRSRRIRVTRREPCTTARTSVRTITKTVVGSLRLYSRLYTYSSTARLFRRNRPGRPRLRTGAVALAALAAAATPAPQLDGQPSGHWPTCSPFVTWRRTRGRHAEM